MSTLSLGGRNKIPKVLAYSRNPRKAQVAMRLTSIHLSQVKPINDGDLENG